MENRDSQSIKKHLSEILNNIKTTHIFITIPIIFLGLLAYLNSFPNPFIWDDIYLVSENLHIRDIGYIPRLFAENVYHLDLIGRFYRPVLMTSFALDYNIWRLDPFGYHLSNILIHLGNALLVYGLIRLIFRRTSLAFLTAALFVLHPIQTEAVTYISGRADPLAAFFCLLSLYFFIRYIDFDGARRKLYFAVSVLCFILVLLTKEASAIFPLVLLFYEACFRRDELKGKRSAKYAVFFVILLIYGVLLRHFVLLNVKDISLTSSLSPLASRLYTMPLIILTYLKLLLFPEGLHMERSDFLFDRPVFFFEPRVIFALSILVAIAAFAWFIRKRSREAFFGFVWFILLLSPVLNIIPINAFVAEHWLYLPSIGFFLIVSSAFIYLFRFRSIKLCILGFIAVILAILGTLTVRQNYIWRNPIAFYRYTLKFYPTSARILNNLGAEYFNLGLYKDAEIKFRESLAAGREGAYAVYGYVNLGSALYLQGKKKESIEVFDEAIAHNPGLPAGYWYMANNLFSDGETKKAVELYRKAAELMPSNAYYWLALGNAYQKEKGFKEAEEAYKKALAACPGFFEARINLGIAYYQQGLQKKAFEEYQKALKLNPGSPEAYYNIGNICAVIGRNEKAKEFWMEALKKDPAHAGAKERLKNIDAPSKKSF
jgi:protein O-mannosyl-transferase